MRDDSQTPLGFLYREIVKGVEQLRRIADILDERLPRPRAKPRKKML